ncbi:KipI family sensor histidine kinase inhibitor [Comamonas sp. BIGb0152]|uniref:5-oxoprolinase subunit PxpB n=1 Tax=Comamonas sp. BIGb0152 TaxID=2940601 RepID=UPI002167681A|nr:5-oxoprolinase subunit PxpB [Comamonas sp. BIGb0152]MCS4296271.1 KipI family sensor histidine kinase inhibitor [Comamonas sp. BIGb0152]
MTHATAMPARKPRISPAGACALLLDVGGHRFCLPTQQRLWAMVAPDSPLRAQRWMKECVLGVNNLLLIYDPLAVEHTEAQALLLQCWEASHPREEAGNTHEVPVDYDLSDAGDLAAIASNTGLSRQEVVQLHSGAQYRVACVGSMPGFAYLVGLPDALSTPRRASPRPSMPKGGVIIGGTQAGIWPYTAPSGWHLLGSTEVNVFDLQRSPPCLFAPGDRVIFKIREVSA